MNFYLNLDYDGKSTWSSTSAHKHNTVFYLLSADHDNHEVYIYNGGKPMSDPVVFIKILEEHSDNDIAKMVIDKLEETLSDTMYYIESKGYTTSIINCAKAALDGFHRIATMKCYH